MPAGSDRPDQDPAAPAAPPGAAGGHAPAFTAGAFTLPNLITLARLCAVPANIWLIIHGRFDLSCVVFLAAGISDAIDGWLARRQGSQSRLGAFLDPLADKALLITTYVALAWAAVLPDWLAIMVVFRDLLIMGGVTLLSLLGAPPRIQPLRISKANTVAQIALAALALLLQGFFPAPGPVAIFALQALVLLVAATTLLSGLAYLVPRLGMKL
ncbi:CDP-alcohol phosphatidyltransferase family protein [Roseomonas sp. USHLN139]|uniref:CDP-alcohol phosphatidyltransferase family protein n=1 Tax=Roseomonas sp. USHLN139 TaxID=3081298 RepID=UPI003B027923